VDGTQAPAMYTFATLVEMTPAFEAETVGIPIKLKMFPGFVTDAPVALSV